MIHRILKKELEPIVPKQAPLTHYMAIANGNWSRARTKKEAIFNIILKSGPGDYVIYACTNNTYLEEGFHRFPFTDTPPAYLGHLPITKEVVTKYKEFHEAFSKLEMDLSSITPEEIKGDLQLRKDSYRTFIKQTYGAESMK